MTNLRIEWDALRVSSIKTRIKTYNVLRNFLRTLRVSSIKTRIKTLNYDKSKNRMGRSESIFH